MAEEEKVVCKYCGKEFSKAGIKNHEKACPENPENKVNIEVRDIDKPRVDAIPEISVVEGAPEKLTDIKLKENLRTYIGDRYYSFTKGKIYQVSENVKQVLKTAGMLEVI